MSRGRSWTASEDKLLKQFAGKKTAAELSIIIGRPKGGIHKRISRLGLSGIRRGENHWQAKLSSIQAQMIIVLHDAGFTTSEIHAAFNGVSMSNVSNIVAGRLWREPL